MQSRKLNLGLWTNFNIMHDLEEKKVYNCRVTQNR